MKRKEPCDVQDLSNLFDTLQCLDGDDEFKLLTVAIHSNNNNENILKNAHQRHCRYLRAIDLTELPLLEAGINKFLQSSDNLSKLKLMKQIDTYIFNILMTGFPKSKKQC
jgi:hypothetical protein